MKLQCLCDTGASWKPVDGRCNYNICVPRTICNSVDGWCNYNVSATGASWNPVDRRCNHNICVPRTICNSVNGWCNYNVCAAGASCNPVDGRCNYNICVTRACCSSVKGLCNHHVCVAGASCNPVDGRCKCKPGYAGTRCEQLCPEGYFGQVSSTFVCHISLSFQHCCGSGSALFWRSWIRIRIGIADPDPGARKLTKIYK